MTRKIDECLILYFVAFSSRDEHIAKDKIQKVTTIYYVDELGCAVVVPVGYTNHGVHNRDCNLTKKHIGNFKCIVFFNLI